MNDISLNILDIAENSISAGAKEIIIKITEENKKDTLKIEIQDNGKGMSKEMLDKVTNPFVTTRTTRKIGLGIPLMKFAAESCGGEFHISSEEGKGTKVEATFVLSSVDRQPLGNMVNTILALAANEHDYSLKFYHRKNDDEFCFETKEFRENAEKLGIGSSETLTLMKKLLEQNYNNFN